MKTTDSVMREKFDKEYPQGITALKFVGGDWIEFDVTKEIQELYSHSLAEARREWIEEMIEQLDTLPCREVARTKWLHESTRLSLTMIYKSDVVHLLTGDNPERKV